MQHPRLQCPKMQQRGNPPEPFGGGYRGAGVEALPVDPDSREGEERFGGSSELVAISLLVLRFGCESGDFFLSSEGSICSRMVACAGANLRVGIADRPDQYRDRRGASGARLTIASAAETRT